MIKRVIIQGRNIKMERGLVDMININLDTVNLLKNEKARVKFFMGLEGMTSKEEVENGRLVKNEYAVSTSLSELKGNKKMVTFVFNKIVSEVQHIEDRIFTVKELKEIYDESLVRFNQISWIEDIAQGNKTKVLVDQISKIAFENGIMILDDLTKLSIKELVKVFHVVRYRLASKGQIEKIDNNMLSIANTNYGAYQRILKKGKAITIDFASTVIDFINSDPRVKLDKGTIYNDKEYFYVVNWRRFGLKDNSSYFTDKGFDYPMWEADMMKMISHAQFAQIKSDYRAKLMEYMRNRPTRSDVKRLYDLYSKLGYYVNYHIVATKTKREVSTEMEQLQRELYYSLNQKTSKEFDGVIKETDFLGATYHQTQDYIDAKREREFDRHGRIYRELEKLARTIAIHSNCSRDDEYINDMLSNPIELREAYRELVRDKKMSIGTVIGQIEEISHFLMGITDNPFEEM